MSKKGTPHVASLQRQLREARQTQPLEMQRLIAHFPAVRQLIRALNELVDLGDSRRSKVIGSGGHGGGELDGVETRGSEEGKSGRVQMRGGFETERYRKMAVDVQDDLARFVRDLSRTVHDTGPGRVPVAAGKLEKRRCRRSECVWRDRWQHGQWDHQAKVYRCQACREPMPDGDKAKKK